MTRIRGIAVATALLATIASTLSVYPHQLAYFNEAAGGPENGHNHLLGSNLDLGQDLLFVKRLIACEEIPRPIHLHYCRHFEPADIGVDSVPFTHADWRRLPATTDDGTTLSACYAISISYAVRRELNLGSLRVPYSIVLLHPPTP